MITFKKYILLNEWTRELMPEIYAALEKYDDPMVGVHFSKGIPERYGEKKKVPHIGLNLRPSHSDPIGIYAFPKDYVLSGQLELNLSFRQFTNFYIVKPSAKAKILNLSTMTDEGAINILRQMGIYERSYQAADIYHKSGKMEAGHRFWGTLEKMRKKIYGDYDKNLSWNKLFKKTPYNVLYDEGSAIIHGREPSQIVYLDSSAMEVLDQGRQQEEKLNVFSFFIKHFPELKVEKQKEYNYFYLKLFSDNYVIYVYPPEYESVTIKVHPMNMNDYGKKIETKISFKNLNEEFMEELKDAISEFEKTLTPIKNEIPIVLQKISERFNIKLKKAKQGDWEIRQKYQDGDKDYVITFYIRTHNNSVIFILSKNQKMKLYNTFGYNENAIIDYKEDYSSEEIVEMGLKELESKRYGSVSVNHDAMKTIELLRKRVFRL
jgi:hypothetical protein